MTLIELLVVISVAAIIVALAAPSFNDVIARQRVRGINAELMTDLQFARSEAVQRKNRVKVTFASNAAFSCYSIYTVDVECDCTATPRCPVGATELKHVSVPVSTTVVLTPARAVVFDPARGEALQDFSINVFSTRSGRLTTSVNKIGPVRVCSPDGSITGVPTPCP